MMENANQHVSLIFSLLFFFSKLSFIENK